MNSALIGYTGFIGSNLARQFAFNECYNTSNISDIRGREFDLVVCGGVSALKWRANQDPVQDLLRIDALLADLRFVRAARMIVLSTVDVYPQHLGVDEAFDCHMGQNHAYGRNRLYFEDEVRAQFGDVTVLRISGVFGPGLKKNVIYDLLHDNCLDRINPDSTFQYYNVAHLWHDIQRIEGKSLRLINMVTEPISTGKLVARFFPEKKIGQNPMPLANYDVRTCHGVALGGSGDYLAGAAEVMAELEEFMAGSSRVDR